METAADQRSAHISWSYHLHVGTILESAKPCYSRCVAVALRVSAGQISHNGQYELEGSASF